MNKKNQVSVRIKQDLYESLQREIEFEKTSQTEIITQALCDYLSRTSPQVSSYKTPVPLSGFLLVVSRIMSSIHWVRDIEDVIEMMIAGGYDPDNYREYLRFWRDCRE